jgi:hypothetical protein
MRRSPAAAGTGGAVGSATSSTFVPHDVQNAASLGTDAPQLGQFRPRDVPQLAQ